MAKDELIGQTFGDFYLYDFDYEKAKEYKYYYKCRCVNCGREKEIQTATIKNGSCTKCTCNSSYNINTKVKGFREDLSRKTFGHLIVNSFNSVKDSHSFWNCTCTLCGNECIRDVSYLKTNNSPMCQRCSVIKGNNNKIKDNKIEYKDDYAIINDKVIVDIEDIDKILSYHRYVSINSSGYAYINWGQKEYFLHRLIMGLPQDYDFETNTIVDHKNGNRLDDRKENLRICNKSNNPMNCRIYKNNTSGCKGVTWLERLGKWQAVISVNKKQIYLGIYANKEDAIRVRKEAEEKYYGEFKRDEAL